MEFIHRLSLNSFLTSLERVKEDLTLGNTFILILVIS